MERYKIIDLSQEIDSGMDVYKGDPEVEVEIVPEIAEKGWEVRRLTMGSHTGTHVDAFSHNLVSPGKPLSKMGIERFFGEARLLENPEEEFPEGVGLVFLKGPFKMSLTKKAVDAKTPFICVPVACHFPEKLERALLSSGVVTYTDLVNVKKLPLNKKFLFCGFPLPIKNGDGSPVRAVAILQNNE